MLKNLGTNLRGKERKEKVIPKELTPHEKLSVVIKAMKAKGGMSKFITALQECQEGLAQEKASRLGKERSTEKELADVLKREALKAASYREGQAWRDSNASLAAQKHRMKPTAQREGKQAKL